jgi:hypothetical protein
VLDRFVPTLWTPRELAYLFGAIEPAQLEEEKRAFALTPPVIEAQRRQRERRLAHEKDLNTIRNRDLRVRNIHWHCFPNAKRTFELKVEFGDEVIEDSATDLVSRWGVVTHSPLLVALGKRKGSDHIKLTCLVKRPGLFWGFYHDGTITWAGRLGELGGKAIPVNQCCTVTFDVEPLEYPPDPADIPQWQPRDRPRRIAWWTAGLLLPALALAFSLACALRRGSLAEEPIPPIGGRIRTGLAPC